MDAWTLRKYCTVLRLLGLSLGLFEAGFIGEFGLGLDLCRRGHRRLLALGKVYPLLCQRNCLIILLSTNLLAEHFVD